MYLFKHHPFVWHKFSPRFLRFLFRSGESNVSGMVRCIDDRPIWVVNTAFFVCLFVCLFIWNVSSVLSAYSLVNI